jgi:hypothetical protein
LWKGITRACGIRKGVEMVTEHGPAILVIVSAFGVSAFSGLSAHLRLAKQVNPVALFAGAFNSGCLGLVIALIWYDEYIKAQNVFGLVGICAAAGMCGSKLTDILVSVLSGAGIDVTIMHKGDKPRRVKNDNQTNS